MVALSIILQIMKEHLSHKNTYLAHDFIRLGLWNIDFLRIFSNLPEKLIPWIGLGDTKTLTGCWKLAWRYCEQPIPCAQGRLREQSSLLFR